MYKAGRWSSKTQPSMETQQQVETAEEAEEKDSPPQTVEGVVEAWMVRAERRQGRRLVLRWRHLAGVEVVGLEAMGQMEAIPTMKVHQAAEVAAHSEVCSALRANPKQGASPAVARVGMPVSDLIFSGAPVLTRHVPAVVAAVGELV